MGGVWVQGGVLNPLKLNCINAFLGKPRAFTRFFFKNSMDPPPKCYDPFYTLGHLRSHLSPTALKLTMLCSINILGLFWSFYILSIFLIKKNHNVSSFHKDANLADSY